MRSIVLISLSVLFSRASTAQTFSDLAIQKVLRDAAPIFGEYHNSNSLKATWMKDYDDDTPITAMNLPGTHDTSTWNYTRETKHALEGLNRINDAGIMAPYLFYRCQSSPLIDMLNGGIRVFDLRFAFDVTNLTLVFYHGNALQSETATVEDVLFGFYQWLDDHPTEALFLSFKDEGGTAKYVPDSAATQQAIHNVLTSNHARRYFVQAKNELGTLGDTRGKITLFRRFSLDKIKGADLPGIYFPGSQWKDNSNNITLVYNSDKNLKAYIEDHYNVGGFDWPKIIQRKYNATTVHLLEALKNEHSDDLFWTFASGGADIVGLYPEAMGLGSIVAETGVNKQLLSFLKQHKGKHLGIVMYDFFKEDDGIVDALLNLGSTSGIHYDLK
ncbi:PLC-like phosphodiesterase [Aspergillus steynii IBT 23096]|uniref:PLC-like phosphodiesterase n=1 Tax=Aspergillus steynii IBT 23096 TaxID=1392250 RepID=A0A2I2FUE5_9EURO|nr:PLC-like phosphodiesterase [Aspergillus steynii IBT 23096]PLB44217.1 PLC-like phosphodiesterase [Aspergillus steynii IBT 23096]